MILSSLWNSRIARLAVMGVAFVALSGLPAYADPGGDYAQHNPGYGAYYGTGNCQDTGWGQNNNWCQNGRGYQNGGRYQYGAPYHNGRGYQNGGGYQDRNRYRLAPYGRPQREQQPCQDQGWNTCQQPSQQQYPANEHTHDDGNSK
jgi:hypothetical protein